MSEGPSSPPASSEKFDRLKDILRTMFQLDRGDLDFGLYRIMNLKAGEIANFLDNDLLPQVQTALAGNATGRQAELERELAQAREQARGLGYDPDTAPKAIELKQQLAEAKADTEAETDVYNHLANFFARYYDEGDFMSLRRYSGGGRSSYLIPYDGEEVKLHWANADQYYIKSTENYASYVFIVGAEKRQVRFEIAEADNERDNVKEASGKQRRFILTESENTQAVEVDNVELVVRFEHRPLTEAEKRTYPGNNSKQQDRINEAAASQILGALEPDWLALLATLAPTESNPDRTVLDKHLATYTAKNSFDYFIHKDLGGFLRRELDLYLKNDVLNVDDLEAGDAARLHRALARMRATRHVADKVITFLAQIEDFQKQLWLKKKFVLETQYCVTLDRVPEALYAEIATNEAQHDEWVKLFAIDEIEGDLANGNTGYTNPLNVEFLRTNPYLVLDTRHFDWDFTDKLLAALSEAGPLDEQMDGLLVHGENFQALNLLQARYREQVKCVYIDPPYNTDASAILYKNGYKSSSWMALISDRLNLSRPLLKNDGVFIGAIDDEQQREFNLLLEDSFSAGLLGTFCVRSNPSGRPTKTGYSVSHEYLLLAGKTEEAFIGRMPPTDKQKERFSQKDERGVFEWRNLRREGSGSDRDDRRALFYPIYVKEGSLRIPAMTWNDNTEEWIVHEEPRSDESIVWPINAKGDEKRWRWGWTTVMDSLDQLGIRRGAAGQLDVYCKRRPNQEGVVSVSSWFEAKYSATEHGTALIKSMFGKSVFSYPKSIYAVTDSIYVAGASREDTCVLDYFAGSGTAAHAVINLNREDDGRRKYILVEVGHYFDTVLLPRIKKVVYSLDWKDGKPVSRSGSTQLFKYIRLESYEDTLDSLDVTPRSSEQEELLTQNPALAEDYRLRYALGEETSGSACLLGKHFTDPFAYTLSVVRDGVRQEVPVDLPETFNFLIGLRLESRQRIDSVLAITGMDPEGKRTLILWRNLNETDNTALEAWFVRHRPTFGSLDLIYVNGDHTLNALRDKAESWTAKTIEPVLRELMFEGANQ